MPRFDAEKKHILKEWAGSTTESINVGLNSDLIPAVNQIKQHERNKSIIKSRDRLPDIVNYTNHILQSDVTREASKSSVYRVGVETAEMLKIIDPDTKIKI